MSTASTPASIELRSTLPLTDWKWNYDVKKAARQRMAQKDTARGIDVSAISMVIWSSIVTLLAYYAFSNGLSITGILLSSSSCVGTIYFMCCIVRENENKKIYEESYQEIEDCYHECRQTFQHEVDLAIRKELARIKFLRQIKL